MPKIGAKADSQITGRMTRDERDAFGKYAQALGLGAGTVATLLMIRELRLNRLSQLKVSPFARQPRNTRGSVTSHRMMDKQKAEFLEYLDTLDTSASEGVGVLCRAELKERWLEKALTSDSKRVKN